MSDEYHQQENWTRIDQWLAMMEEETDRQDNELMSKVTENFRYLDEHVDEWDNGSLQYDDLPHFSIHLKWLIHTSVRFGIRLAVEMSTVYVVSRDGRFVSIYGKRENAMDRVADTDELEMEEAEPRVKSVEEILAPMREASGSGPNALAENLEYLYTNIEAFSEGNLRAPDLPALPEDTRTLIILAVQFGVLWEQAFPSLYAILDGRNGYHDLYHSRERATAAAEELGPMYHAERVTPADGDLPPAEIIPGIEELP